MKPKKPHIAILVTDGTNCHHETVHAVKLCSGNPEVIHMNQLKSGSVCLNQFKGLVIPGGFSYGDDVSSGKILALELLTLFEEDLQKFNAKRKPILGICNGFQVLVRTGLLPFGVKRLGKMDASLLSNKSGQFQCKWVDITVPRNCSHYTTPLDTVWRTWLQIAHGEGRFYAEPPILRRIEKQGQVVMKYRQNPNPNGSEMDIAGICDPSGLIMGLMPHPERFIEINQDPKKEYGGKLMLPIASYLQPNFSHHLIPPPGQVIFQNFVRLASYAN